MFSGLRSPVFLLIGVVVPVSTHSPLTRFSRSNQRHVLLPPTVQCSPPVRAAVADFAVGAAHRRGRQPVEPGDAEFFGEAEQAEAKPESESSTVHDFIRSEAVACGPERRSALDNYRTLAMEAAENHFWPQFRSIRAQAARSFMYSSCTAPCSSGRRRRAFGNVLPAISTWPAARGFASACRRGRRLPRRRS